MKRRIIILTAILLACAGCAALWANVSDNDFINANADGIMMTPRSSNGDAYPCHFSSRSAGESTFYVDCNKCIKVYGQKGVGKTSDCGYSIFN